MKYVVGRLNAVPKCHENCRAGRRLRALGDVELKDLRLSCGAIDFAVGKGRFDARHER